MSSKHVLVYRQLATRLSDAFSYAFWLACDNPSQPIASLGMDSESFDPRALRTRLSREAVDILSIMRVTPGVGTDVRTVGDDLRANFSFSPEIHFNVTDPLVRYCTKLFGKIATMVPQGAYAISPAILGIPVQDVRARFNERTRAPIVTLDIRGGNGAYLWHTGHRTPANLDGKLIEEVDRVLRSLSGLSRSSIAEVTPKLTESVIAAFGMKLGSYTVETFPYSQIPGHDNFDLSAFMMSMTFNGQYLHDILSKSEALATMRNESFFPNLQTTKVTGINMTLNTGRLKGCRNLISLATKSPGLNIMQGGPRGSSSDLYQVFQDLDVMVQFTNFLPDMPRILERVSRGILKRVLTVLDSRTEVIPEEPEMVEEAGAAAEEVSEANETAFVQETGALCA